MYDLLTLQPVLAQVGIITLLFFTMHSSFTSLSATAFLLTSALAAPALNIKRSLQSIDNPALAEDFPDPCIINVGGTWHAFATQSGGTGHYGNHVQHATSTDFYTWTYDDSNGVFPNVPAWVTSSGSNVWGPSVIQRVCLTRASIERLMQSSTANTFQDDGTFVLYFSANAASQTGNGATHCLGVATSSNVAGPYTATSDQPLACPLDIGGAIDPASFRDDDGTYYLVYKIDGNSVGMGTPIMLQKLQGDAVTPTGDAPVELFREGPYDSGNVEAPNIIKVDGTYFCFFSSAGYCSTSYDESYAYASSVTGPWTKASQPLLVTGDYGLQGPGGLGIGPTDNTHVAVHSWPSANQVCTPDSPGRYMYVGEISVSGNTISI